MLCCLGDDNHSGPNEYTDITYENKTNAINMQCISCNKNLSKCDKVILKCGHGYHLSCIMNFYSFQMKNNTSINCIKPGCMKKFKTIPLPVEKQHKKIYTIIDRERLVNCRGTYINNFPCKNLSYPGNNGFCKIHGTSKLTPRTLDLLTEFYINIPLYTKDNIRAHLYNICKLKLEMAGDKYNTIDDIEKDLYVIYVLKFKKFSEIYKYYGLEYHHDVIF
jgi:hypothetical protein